MRTIRFCFSRWLQCYHAQTGDQLLALLQNVIESCPSLGILLLFARLSSWSCPGPCSNELHLVPLRDHLELQFRGLSLCYEDGVDVGQQEIRRPEEEVPEGVDSGVIGLPETRGESCNSLEIHFGLNLVIRDVHRFANPS